MPLKVRPQLGFYPRNSGDRTPVGRWQLSKREMAVGLDGSGGRGGAGLGTGGMDLTRLWWTKSQ